MPAHFTAISMWIEAHRLLPAVTRERRIAFCNGLGLSFMAAAHIGTGVGYYLAASLPPLLTAGMLFLTPVSFLISTTRNCRLLSDWLALGFGIVLAPLLVWWQVDWICSGPVSSRGRQPTGFTGCARSSSELMTGLEAYVLLVLVGFLPTEIWRLLGLVLVRGIDERSELFIWARAVATAVLAGVIAKIVLFPPGALAGVPLTIRLCAIGGGFITFLAWRRSVFFAVLVSEILLLAGATVADR